MIQLRFNQQRMQLWFGIVSFGIVATVMITGLWLMVHSVRHLGDPTDASASASIDHIGSVTGAPHVVALFIGMSLVSLALLYCFKVYQKVVAFPASTAPHHTHPSHGRNRLHFEPTATGKAIRIMKQFSPLHKEE